MSKITPQPKQVLSFFWMCLFLPACPNYYLGQSFIGDSAKRLAFQNTLAEFNLWQQRDGLTVIDKELLKAWYFYSTQQHNKSRESLNQVFAWVGMNRPI